MSTRILKIIINLILVMTMLWVNYAWAVDESLPPDIAAIQQRGVLRAAVFKGNAKPLVMQTSTGDWEGIEVDLAKMVADQLGVKLVLVPAKTYDEMVNMVAAQQVDMSSELAVLPGRALKVSLTHPYNIYNPHLLVNRLQAAKYGWNNQSEISQGLQLGQVPIKLGVLASSASVPLMQLAFPKATLVEYPDINQGFQDVIDGKIFATLGTTPVEIQKFLQNSPHASLLAEDIEVTQVKIMISIAVPWQDFHFRELLNSYFAYLERNGILDKILEKYGDTSHDS